MKPWLTQKELREAIGLSERQVATLVTRVGVPKKPHGSSWLYAWPDFVRWYGDERERAGRAKARPATEDEARKRKLAAEAELAELELAQQRGQLMTVEQYEQRVGGAFSRVAAQLKSAPTKFAPQVVGLKTLPEAVTKLQIVADEILDDLHRGTDIPDDDDADRDQ